MQRHPGYTRDRIAQVGDRIRALVRADVRDPDALLVAGPVDRIEPVEAESLSYRPCAIGAEFGPLWATFWCRVEATVPAEWDGERVDLLWVSHSEATLWESGRALQGLNTSPDGARSDAMVRARAVGGELLDLRVELACNGLFGELDRPYAKTHRLWRELANFTNVILPGKGHLSAVMKGFIPQQYIDVMVAFITANDPGRR